MTSRASRLGTTLTSCLVALLLAMPVEARKPKRQAASAADPQAEKLRDLYARGQAAFDAGSYETAIAVFEEAYGISKDPNLHFNIHLCHDRLEHYEEAIAALDRYVAESPDEDAADVARRKQSLEMRRDRAAQAKAEEAARAAEAEVLEPAPEPEPMPEPPRERLFSPAAWTLTAVSATGFIVGITFGALSLTRKKSADCQDVDGETVCSGSGARDARDSRTFAIVSDVGIGVGAVAAVAVIAIVATRAARRRRADTTAWAPILGPHTAGLGWATRF